MNVPKDYKRTLAPNIEKDLLVIVRSVGFANKSHDSANRIGYITDAMHYTYDVKLLIRILCDLRTIPSKQYMMLSDKLLNISSQLAGWKKYMEQKREGEIHICQVKA